MIIIFFLDLQYNIIMEGGKLIYSGIYSVDIRLYQKLLFFLNISIITFCCQ